jgi:predicted amidohydrolase YtcJ
MSPKKPARPVDALPASMRLLYNARVHTLDAAHPQAEAVLVDGGHILAVGGDELVEAAPVSAERYDLGGKTVLPGLTDAHLHLQHYALGLRKVDCETATLAACLERVAERARNTPAGEWILGHGWQQNDWSDLPPEGGGFPTADLLDAVAPQNPVYLTAKSLHAGWLNSAGMRLAGISSTTPDPPDGRILHSANGEATGILLEDAVVLANQALPQYSAGDVAQAIQQAQPILWKMGLTGVHDFDQRTCFMALQLLHQNGTLGLRVTKSVPVDLLPHAHALGLRTGFGDDLLRIGSIKVFMDGALGPRTAAMFQPYLSEPENRGILNMDGEELFEIGRQAAEAGLSLAVHAIGDRANHEVLNAFEQLRGHEAERGLPALRHRIEHVQILHPVDRPRLAGLRIIASMQPVHATSDMLAADRFWGKRSRYAYAWKTQQNHGALLAFGSDAPVESPNPFWGLHAAVTRRRADGSPAPEGWYPAERVTMQTALEAYTLGPVFATGMEDRLGKLRPGYLADLIVLEQDPFTCPSDDLFNLAASATMLAGRWVWDSGLGLSG